MADDTNFKFGTFAQQCPDMTLKKFSKNERGHGHVTTNFWALTANSSKWLKIRTLNLARMLPGKVFGKKSLSGDMYIPGGILEADVHGQRSRGRQRKRWIDVVKYNMEDLRLDLMDVENRAEWRRRTRVADPSPEGFNLA